MTMPSRAGQAAHALPIRIERGSPGPEELAALTAVFLSRAAGREPAGLSGRRTVARWLRLERVRGFDSPRSWRAAGR